MGEKQEYVSPSRNVSEPERSSNYCNTGNELSFINLACREVTFKTPISTTGQEAFQRLYSGPAETLLIKRSVGRTREANMM